MTDIALITLSGLKNSVRSRTTTAIVLAVTLVCAVGLAATFSLVFIAPEMREASPDHAQLANYYL